jgi:hypothetical protein
LASVNTNHVSILQGCEMREISLLINPLLDGGESAMKLMVLLRWDNSSAIVYASNLLTPFQFAGSYPVSR